MLLCCFVDPLLKKVFSWWILILVLSPSLLSSLDNSVEWYSLIQDLSLDL
jgi:hypothetical protein